MRWLTVLTQYVSDLAEREDAEKAGDARTDCEHCQLAFVQLSNFIDGHMRFLGQSFDSSLVWGAFVKRRGRGNSVHIVTFLR